MTNVPFRPPAIPLVTIDPYINAWSLSDQLYDDWPRHWTDAWHSLCGLIRIDGVTYRFLGGAMPLQRTAVQEEVAVRPTQTIYRMTCGSVRLIVTFTTPLLLDDLELLSRPVSYVSFDVMSEDGNAHEVALYFDVSGEWAVDQPQQAVRWARVATQPLALLSMESVEQNVLQKKGDDLRIDWGTLYLAAPSTWGQTAIADAQVARGEFVASGALPQADLPQGSLPANSFGGPVLATSTGTTRVTSEAQSWHLLLAYDDGYAIEYMHQPLRSWWRRDESTDPLAVIATAEAQYADIMARCQTFDVGLMAQALGSGGHDYQQLCALAYRQAICAHKLVAGPEGQAFFFSKENNSNGCIGTVDVTYPSAPLFLLYNPDLLKGMIEPIFDYCRSGAWSFPFAAHDLGTYPQANGNVYGGNREEDQMPVEESGNMLILTAAIARCEGSTDFARKHWDLLSQWAGYLKDWGFDPANQLCTDDFAGHLAHNANLSLKAILALACYGQMAEALGEPEIGAGYLSLADDYAQQWQQAAYDGDHYRLAFDQAGTWSQKYNLVWDEMLGLNLFDPEIARTEIAYYLGVQNAYGLPLDSRRTWTKSDWIVWTATMAEKAEDFEAFIAPIYRYAHETPRRVPLGDWHDTITSVSRHFRARSVVGGYFIKLLADKLSRR